jgi:hypothetical protein
MLPAGRILPSYKRELPITTTPKTRAAGPMLQKWIDRGVPYCIGHSMLVITAALLLADMLLGTELSLSAVTTTPRRYPNL